MWALITVPPDIHFFIVATFFHGIIPNVLFLVCNGFYFRWVAEHFLYRSTLFCDPNNGTFWYFDCKFKRGMIEYWMQILIFLIVVLPHTGGNWKFGRPNLASFTVFIIIIPHAWFAILFRYFIMLFNFIFNQNKYNASSAIVKCSILGTLNARVLPLFSHFHSMSRRAAPKKRLKLPLLQTNN